MRTKFFAWLLMNDSLNTIDELQRRHWKVNDDTHCVLCPGRLHEDRDHLFFNCNFSIRIWNYLQVTWTPGDNMMQILTEARREFNQPFFVEVILLASWSIWKVRNAQIFEGVRPRFYSWRSRFVHDISLQAHRLKNVHKNKLLDWIAALP